MIVSVRARAGGIFVSCRPRLRCAQAGNWVGGFRRSTVHLYVKHGVVLCHAPIAQFVTCAWPAHQATCRRCMAAL